MTARIADFSGFLAAVNALMFIMMAVALVLLILNNYRAVLVYVFVFDGALVESARFIFALDKSVILNKRLTSVENSENSVC